MPCRTTKSIVGSTLVQYRSGHDRYHRKLNSDVPNAKPLIPKISDSHNRTLVAQKRQTIWFSYSYAALHTLLEQQVQVHILRSSSELWAPFERKLPHSDKNRRLPMVCWRDRKINVCGIAKQLFWSSVWKHKWRLSDFHCFHWLETLCLQHCYYYIIEIVKKGDKYRVCWESLWQADIRIVIHQAVSLVYIKIIKYMVFQSANLCLSNALAAVLYS